MLIGLPQRFANMALICWYSSRVGSYDTFSNSVGRAAAAGAASATDNAAATASFLISNMNRFPSLFEEQDYSLVLY